MQDYNENVRSLIKVAKELISVADKGHAECMDENCVSLYGLAKDCGYRIRTAAERESVEHDAKYGKASLAGARKRAAG
ncbi:MAG: hypothetical protein WCO42_05995 [bacterium]